MCHGTEVRNMTKQELLQFLEPFSDEIEIAVVEETNQFAFDLEYKPTGFGLKGDEAAVVLRVGT